MAITRVVMPKLSDAMETGKLLKWLKKEGDRVEGGEILAEIETTSSLRPSARAFSERFSCLPGPTFRSGRRLP
jgi:multidrug efflux pump subunit AcrA (membrane-fusion protein)